MEQNTIGVTYWIVFSTTMHIMAFVAVTLHALQRRRNASATILWIFTAWSFPLFGPLFYLTFGIDRVPSQGLKKKVANQLLMSPHNSSSALTFQHLKHRADLLKTKNPTARQLHQAIDALNPEHPLLEGCTISPLLCGDQTYPLMLASIRNAKNHIHMQSFIFGNDDTGKQFLEALKTKAEEGVKVRLMFDTFGSTHAYLGGLFRKYKKIQNFELCGWTQANPLKRQFQINLRNHRKNLIIDGQVAFFGGVNVSKENTTTLERKAIRDYHFKAEGPIVHELQLSFLRDWYFMTHEPITQLLIPAYFPTITSQGPVRSRIIDSGPSESPGLIGETFFNAIILAQHQILLVTPYFVPTTDLLKALHSAARRGVNVCIVLPEENNHIYAGLASKSLFEELLDAGVRIFQRKPPFIHAKAMTIDNSIALVGTANVDIRSLELNYETTVVFDDESAVSKLMLMIHEDIEQSTELGLNQWIRRPMTQKLAENLCVLLTPIL